MDRVCHFEIPVSDRNRPGKFYSNVFGWQINDVPSNPYSFAITPSVAGKHHSKELGSVNGGMHERDDQGSKSSVVVIGSESCEQRVKDVQIASGAFVMGPMQVGDMGIYNAGEGHPRQHPRLLTAVGPM